MLRPQPHTTHDGNVRSYIPVPDVTAARNREVLVVRTFWILEGDGCSALLLLPLPLLSSPFLTGVVAVLRVMKRRSGVAVELPEPSREPYWEANCCRRSSLYCAIRSARRRCVSAPPSGEQDVAIPSKDGAFDVDDVRRSLKH